MTTLKEIGKHQVVDYGPYDLWRKNGMKKILLVLLMAMALVSVATAEVTLSGEFDYGMMTDGDVFGGSFDKIELDLAADIDEYNTFEMEIEDTSAGNDPAGTTLDLNYATVTTDWEALLDLPIAVTTTVGLDGFSGGDNHDVTGWGLEAMGGFGINKEGAAKIDLGVAEGVGVYAAMNFDTVTADESEILLGATLDFAPVSAELYYVNVGDGYAEGAFGAEASFVTEVGDGMDLSIAGSMIMDLDDTVGAGNEMLYGAGVAFAAAGATLGVSVDGNDDVALANVGFDANYGLTDDLAADLGIKYDLDASELLCVDVSAAYSAGAVTYRLGYVVTDGFGADYNAIVANTDGGVYLNVNVDF